LQTVFESDARDWTISLAPGIPVARGGTLQLSFASDVNLATQVGRTFDLFDWSGGVTSSTFNIASPHVWDVSKLCTTGEVTLLAFLPGDFNNDGAVNAADYVTLRKNSGGMYTPDDYNTWRADFGASSGSASSMTTAPTVPEPATLFLLFGAATGAVSLRPRTKTPAGAGGP
jgi:hypothetical protein